MDSANATPEESHLCERAGCNKPAKLKCPTCLKLHMTSYFCCQDCFKSGWSEHKQKHGSVEVAQKPAPYDPWPTYHFTGPLRPFPLSPRRTVPDTIEKPDYGLHPLGHSLSEEQARGSAIVVLNDEEMEQMRIVCKMAREVMDAAYHTIGVGVTTDEIDRVVHEACIERDCYPSPLNYYEFPKSVCTSVNEVICHGIPDGRPLQDGDIVNVDVTAYHRGFHGDLNETFIVGHVDDDSRRLMETAYNCLAKAIAIVKPGTRYRDVGDVITKHAQANGCSVVRSYCGHGVHRLFHTSPNVPHYANNKALGVMKPGHCFTIEPMINAGNCRDVKWPDDWTAVTMDGRRSAQFEQTLLVTDAGCEVLTRRRDAGGRPYYMDQLGLPPQIGAAN